MQKNLTFAVHSYVLHRTLPDNLSIYKTFRVIKFAAQISMMAKLEASTEKGSTKVISKRALQRNQKGSK